MTLSNIVESMLQFADPRVSTMTISADAEISEHKLQSSITTASLVLLRAHAKNLTKVAQLLHKVLIDRSCGEACIIASLHLAHQPVVELRRQLSPQLCEAAIFC